MTFPPPSPSGLTPVTRVSRVSRVTVSGVAAFFLVIGEGGRAR
jgi:hypothetical protein